MNIYLSRENQNSAESIVVNLNWIMWPSEFSAYLQDFGF
jgi:hypothetical protein